MSGEEIRFNFAKYDVGGKGAKAGDGKLTGEEVEKAKADGWNVWDGMPKAGKENQEPPRLDAQQSLFKFNKIPPVKMPTVEDKSNDTAFDITSQIDKSNDKAFDTSNHLSKEQLDEQLSKINGKKLMEDFINKYGQ